MCEIWQESPESERIAFGVEYRQTDSVPREKYQPQTEFMIVCIFQLEDSDRAGLAQRSE